MTVYQAYGLKVSSELLLPELASDEDSTVPADVVIRFGSVDAVPPEAPAATSDGFTLELRGGGRFLVRGGREIVIDRDAGCEPERLRPFVLGIAFAILLHQRSSWVVLHASAVSIDGEAVAFAGEKGMGKSSTAASLHARGHDLVADDIVAIDTSDEGVRVIPGFPSMKLWPDLVAFLGRDPEAFPRVVEETEKRTCAVSTDFASEPQRLRSIFILAQGTSPVIERLPPRAAFTALLPHWYGARFSKELLAALGYASHFSQCARLAERIPVYHLRRPHALESLPDVIELVEAHCSI